MNTVQVYTLTVATSATGTQTIYVGNTEQILFYLPKVSTVFGSGVVAFSLQGASTSTIAPVQVNYWDYGSTTPKSCVVTASTGGIYELPNAGGTPYIRIQFDIAATNATSAAQVMTPRTTY